MNIVKVPIIANYNPLEIIGTVELRSDIATKMAEMVVQTAQNFVLYCAIKKMEGELAQIVNFSIGIVITKPDK